MVNKEENWFVYIVRCSDDSYYTGITTDVDIRLNEHNDKGVKNTKEKLPVVLEEFLEFPDMESASKEEYRINQLSKNDKEVLIGEWRIDRLRKEFVIKR
jgi:putative endonuclease